MKRTIRTILSLTLVVSLLCCTLVAYAKDTDDINESSVTSNYLRPAQGSSDDPTLALMQERSLTAVSEALINAVSSETIRLSDDDYELIREFIKLTPPADSNESCSLWVLNKYLSLILKSDRTIEIRRGPWTIGDIFEACQTIDNAGLAEPEFPVFGFANATWILDPVANVIRKWCLGEEELTIPMPLKGDPLAGDIFVSVNKSFTSDSEHCFLYNNVGELVILDGAGNVTFLTDDYAYFTKCGVARFENSLYFINSDMHLVHFNLLTNEKVVLDSKATALDFELAARYYDGTSWIAIPSYINKEGENVNYVIPPDMDWLVTQ